MESLSGERVVRQHVRADVILYPHAAGATQRSSGRVLSHHIGAGKQDAGSIIACSFGKTLGAAAGQWALTLKSGRDLDLAGDDVAPGDWARLGLVRNGWRFPVALGPVQSVRETRTAVDGTTVRTYTVTGTDHGGPFEAPMVYNSLYVQSLSELSKGLQATRVGSRIGGSPSELFGVLIRAAFAAGESGSRSAWALPPGLARGARKTLLDILHIDAQPTRGGRCNETEMWTQPGQTLHQTLQNWCNPLLNETLYDLTGDGGSAGDAGDGEPSATLRERPFPTVAMGMASPWFSLPTVSLPDWLIEESDLGRNAAERFNLFELTADLGAGTGQVEQTVFCPPVWDPASIQAHGLQPMMETTRYIGFEAPAFFKPTFAPGIAGPVAIVAQGVKASMAAWSQERAAWLRTLVDWHGPNPYLHSGTITVGIALPEIRPGMRLEILSANAPRFTAYVEGVQLHAAWGLGGPRATTALTVTRGHYGSDESLLELVRDVSARYVSTLQGGSGAAP